MTSRPVKTKRTVVHRQMINPSLTSLFSSFTQSSNGSSGSGSTVNQDSMTKRLRAQKKTSQKTHGSSRQLAKDGTDRDLRAGGDRPNVFDYMEEWESGKEEGEEEGVRASRSRKIDGLKTVKRRTRQGRLGSNTSEYIKGRTSNIMSVLNDAEQSPPKSSNHPLASPYKSIPRNFVQSNDQASVAELSNEVKTGSSADAKGIIDSPDTPLEIEVEITKFVVQEGFKKFRCKIEECPKVFNSEQNWRRHVSNRHAAWLDALKQDPTAFTDSGYASHIVDSGLSEDDLQDGVTIYSLPNLPDSKKDNYQLAFVSSLLKDLQLQNLGADLFDRPKDTLSEVLRTFALRLGRSAKNDRDYNAMFFIMKYRSEISDVFEYQWREQERNIARDQSQGMSSEERVRHWQKQQENDPPESPESDPEETMLDGPVPTRYEEDMSFVLDRAFQLEATGTSDIQPTNLEFVTNTPAYTWLISKLVNYTRLSSPLPNTLEYIRATINDCFPRPRKINRHTPQLQYSMTFNLISEIVPFLQTYYFDGKQDIADILETFVTITSDGFNEQALTVPQYLRQTWSQTGENILSLMVNVTRDGHASILLPEGSIHGRTSGVNLVFEVVGNTEFIVETGGQLAWLGTVIRPSPVQGCAYDCKAFITNIVRYQTSHPHINAMDGNLSTNHRCNIEYSMELRKPALGDCWIGLFNYPVIAYGFPVLKQPRSVQGLEVSLGAMLALCHTEHIGIFNDRIIMKGFSSMFSLSERRPGISIWHFSGDANGSYISCSSMTDQVTYQNLGVHEVLEDRHFVGWCSDVRYGAGAVDNQYNIQLSLLSRAPIGNLLFGKSIRRGCRPRTEAVSVASSKELPRRTGGQSYLERLKRLHSRPVVLWDVEDQRGWLTNGTSALLHLVLASVEEEDGGLFDTYCLRKTDIRQYETGTENAAAYILRDEENLKLPILSHGGEPVLLRERIEDFYFLLDLMIEHQINALLCSSPVSGIIEGWDFTDVSSNICDPLYPRFLSIEKLQPWRSLLDDTNAVVLFGNNFGEIFTPKTNSGLCEYWNILPKFQFHLAASVKDLDQITRGYRGNNKANPRKLTENTTWPIVRRTFSKCICFTSPEAHSDLVQVLVPNSMFTAQPDLTASNYRLPPNGAVIFGEVKDCVWFRSNTCTTIESRPLERIRSDTSSEVNDSGIGDSISSGQPIGLVNSTIQAEEYLVAIICALPKELLAVRFLFDQRYADPVFDKNDKNSYAFGRIGLHKIVAACLPAMYGTCSATRVTTELRRSFPSVKSCLVVGIGGGIPSEKNDIRLGDVVVSRPFGSNTGIVKYDFEKVMQDGKSELLGSLPQPPEHLLSVIRILESDPQREAGSLQEYLQAIGDAHPQYRYPGANQDKLFLADHNHRFDGRICTHCERYLVLRESRRSTQPYIHYGLIASGDKVVKDAKTRGRIGSKYNALCFEMEGAGVTAVLPSLIIRGICDYSDTHKNDNWQEYAAATAAAYAKLLLKKMRA